MENCIFCKISAGIIESKKILENEFGFVIQDLYPQSKVHLLVISKKHIKSLGDGFMEYPEEMKKISGELLSLGFRAAEKEKLFPDGFRTVINTNEWGGQSVYHLHVHIMGGEKLSGKFA